MTAGPAYDELARWIVDQERAGVPGEPADVAERAARKFYVRLSSLVTIAGSQAFLARALHLARADYPFLDGVSAGATPDRCFEGVDGALRDIEHGAALDAFSAVFAEMIRLLVTFIGEDLTMHVVREVWPEAPQARGETEEERT